MFLMQLVVLAAVCSFVILVIVCSGPVQRVGDIVVISLYYKIFS